MIKLPKILKRLFIQNVSKRYEYGKIANGLKARRCIITGKVEMLLWKAGEQGHKTDFYHIVGLGWEETFNVC